MSSKFKKGEIVRYDYGETALMRVDGFRLHGGNMRYYGRHVLGGSQGRYEDQLTKASSQDLETWDKENPEDPAVVTDEIMFRLIADELAKARKKFPGNKHQLAAFNEEAGELTRAMLEYEYEQAAQRDIVKEAVQSAAMAIRVAVEGSAEMKYSYPSGYGDGRDGLAADAHR